jgi:hypothetical protein
MKNAIALFVLASVCSVGTAFAQDDHNDHNHGNSGHIKRVLLISIDGMHAVDFANCVHGISTIDNGHPYCPALASLGRTGINYVAASTSKPSDSFPGLTAIITGGSPALTGVYYDVAYARNLDAPAITTGNGVAGGPCKAFSTPTGTTTEYEEGIDIDQTLLNGGAPGASLTDGGINSIDPKKLPRDPNNGCNPVFPWDFVRANSIFSVIHQAGGYTAWSDKHPAYSSVASGLGPIGLDDFYAPEINSNVVALPAVQTPTGLSCVTVPDPTSDLTSWTNSFQSIQCYDTLKVNAIVHEIDGMDHLGKKRTHVPTIFGMNFQAVSVGQKLIEATNNVGGYLDAAGTPSANLLSEIRFVDASIEEFVDKLQANGLYDSTLIVITAKHGQSPIDPNRYVSNLKKGSSPATLLSNAGFIPDSESTLTPGGIGPTEDDVSLLWLKSSSQTIPSVAILEANAAAIGLGQIYYGPAVTINYNDPTVDPRTPDIIVTPNVGVTYTKSSSKQEEHGGFAHDDTNVMLLLSNVNFDPKTVHAEVGTAQVAPTILGALGIDPSQLDAVRAEGTSVLPDSDLW